MKRTEQLFSLPVLPIDAALTTLQLHPTPLPFKVRRIGGGVKALPCMHLQQPPCLLVEQIAAQVERAQRLVARDDARRSLPSTRKNGGRWAVGHA
eukprot:6184619-Pleurochrysis_carterae.AAC.1